MAERYGLKSQIQRAAVSIPSNIAEGCSRPNEREFKHYLEISIGSAYELETQLIIIQNVGMICKEKIDPVLRLLTEIQKMINSFITSIKIRKSKPKT